MQRTCSSILILLMSVLTGFLSVNAQSMEMTFQTQPLEKTKLHPLKVDISAYAKMGVHNCGKLWKDTYRFVSARDQARRLYGTYADVGASAACFIYDSWSIVGSLGYKQERFAFDQRVFDSNGIRSQWISTDVGVNIINYVVLGAQTDFFLNSHTQSNGNIGYSGLGKDCFNPVALGIYAGIHFAVLKFRAEIRYGFQIKNHLSADKLANSNMERTSLKREFFEVKLAYDLFTTKSRYHVFKIKAE